MISYMQDISENNDTYYCLSSFSDFGQFKFSSVSVFRWSKLFDMIFDFVKY